MLGGSSRRREASCESTRRDDGPTATPIADHPGPGRDLGQEPLPCRDLGVELGGRKPPTRKGPKGRPAIEGIWGPDRRGQAFARSVGTADDRCLPVLRAHGAREGGLQRGALRSRPDAHLAPERAQGGGRVGGPDATKRLNLAGGCTKSREVAIRSTRSSACRVQAGVGNEIEREHPMWAQRLPALRLPAAPGVACSVEVLRA